MEFEKENLLDRNYSLDFNKVINESWNLFTKVIGIGALAVLIYGFSSILLNQVTSTMTGLNLKNQVLLEDIQGSDDMQVIISKTQDFYSENLVSISSNAGLVQLILILAFPLAGGFMLVCREMETKGMANISTLFAGFKPQYWSRLMALGLIYFFISKIALLFFILPGIYIWAAACIACPLVMFHQMSGWEAFKTSISLVNKNWFSVFKLLFVASLFGLMGYLACGIGRVFTYPLVLVTIYIMYKHIIGFPNDQIEEIGHS
ncbi:MAG: hypothetical protein WDA08_08320 [Weeksellaceae bacterium]